jgi:hypothetical protein
MTRCLCAIVGGAVGGILLLVVVAFVMSEHFDMQLVDLGSD